MIKTKVCEHCGEEFEKKEQSNSTDWAKARYCGLRCFARAQARKTGKSPGRDELLALYSDAKMTTSQIGSRYGTSGSTVSRWLKRAGIDARTKGPPSSNVRNGTPSKEELADLVHVRHMTYRQIGTIYGVDARMVGLWLTKHQIPKPSTWDTRYGENKPQLPDAETLRELYDSGLSTDAIGADCGTSGSVILGLCKKYGIERRRPGFRYRGEQACDDGTHVRSAYEHRVGNWLLAHSVPFEYEPRVPFHKRWRADFLANGWFVEVWGVQGWAAYDEKRRQKSEWYRAHELPLIEIIPSDSHRTEMFERQMAQCLTPAVYTPKASRQSATIGGKRIARSSRPLLVCQQCGKEYVPKPGRVFARANPKYCGQECYRAGRWGKPKPPGPLKQGTLF